MDQSFTVYQRKLQSLAIEKGQTEHLITYDK